MQLIGPEFPIVLEHLWSYFLQLSSARSQGYSGPAPITYQDIKAWSELTNTPLSPLEVEAIKRLDAIYMRVVNNGRS